MNKKENQITGVTGLRDDLLKVYQSLRDGEIGLREAKERANCAGKVLQSAKLQLEYHAYTKSDARIPFLES
jgi:hypothetical protein